MSIEELSRRAGVTTRNIRAYQSRELLPSPVNRRGERAAFYTAEHLARLRLISRLQERGFSLAGIAELVGAWAEGKSLDQVLGFESALAESTEDQSRIMSEAALRALLPPGMSAERVLPRFVAVGLVARHRRGYRIRHPKVFDLGIDAMASGIPVDALLDEFVRLQSDFHGIALRFVSLFNTYILTPYLEQGMPAERLGEIVERMNRLRQLAVEAGEALLRQAMADEIEAAERESLPKPKETTGSRPPRPRASAKRATTAR